MGKYKYNQLKKHGICVWCWKNKATSGVICDECKSKTGHIIVHIAKKHIISKNHTIYAWIVKKMLKKAG